MQMRRVCIVLSAVLLAVNVLFLVMYRSTERELTTLSESLVNDAAAFFASRGCEVKPEAITVKIPDHAVYSLHDVPLEQTAREIAKRLASAGSNAVVTPIETPDSLICRTESGKVPCAFRLSYDALGFMYARSGAVPADGNMLDEIRPFFANDAKVLSGETSKAVKEFMKRALGKQGGDYDVCGTETEGGRVTVCVSQNFGGTPIRGCYACLTVENGEVSTASGRLLFAGTAKKYRETLTDGVNALRNLDLSKMKSVSSESIVYDVRYTDSGVGYLVPSWEIRGTDENGEEMIRYSEAIVGIM